jgi:hypothetical protein
MLTSPPVREADEAEQVDERDPLDGGERHAEVVLHGREGDRHDAGV